jgi:putative NADH-flavin reductase
VFILKNLFYKNKPRLMFLAKFASKLASSNRQQTLIHKVIKMKITIFGAGGNVGKCAVNEALSRGHNVTAVFRDITRSGKLNDAVNIVQGDASNVDDVVRISSGQDLVISATRPPQGSEYKLLDVCEALLNGLEISGVKLLLVGGAASLILPNSNGRLVIDDDSLVPPAWRGIAEACLAQFKLCQDYPSFNWTYVSPPALIMSGERTGKFRLGTDELVVDDNGQSKITFEDFAVALIDEAEQENHIRERFTVAY